MDRRRFTPRSLIARDALFAIPAAAVAVMTAATNAWATRPDGIAAHVLFAAVALVVLPFRRSHPVESWLVSLVLAACLPGLVLRAEPGQVVLAFSTYSLLANSDRVAPATAAVSAFLAASAGSVAMDLQLDGLGLDTFLMPALAVTYGVGLGAVVRVNRRTAADLAARNAELVALGELAQREAVLAERGRIARDLHDIVAHHVSGMVLHARGARDALDRTASLAAAKEALDRIAASGSEALSSMRGLLAMLRDGDLELAPQPGLDDLPALVDAMATRRLPTTLAMSVADVAGVPADVQLSAYRIVQEALTNASRHAHARHAAVIVELQAHGLHVLVDDNGIGPAGGYREGHGLVGMRERAALVGGSITVARSPSGGWRIEAQLPTAPAADVATAGVAP